MVGRWGIGVYVLRVLGGKVAGVAGFFMWNHNFNMIALIDSPFF